MDAIHQNFVRILVRQRLHEVIYSNRLEEEIVWNNELFANILRVCKKRGGGVLSMSCVWRWGAIG